MYSSKKNKRMVVNEVVPMSIELMSFAGSGVASIENILQSIKSSKDHDGISGNKGWIKSDDTRIREDCVKKLPADPTGDR